MRVTIFIRNIEGGVATYVRNFLRYRPKDKKIFYRLVIVSDDLDKDSKVCIGRDFEADEILGFEFSKYENRYGVLKRLKAFIGRDTDLVVANERMEISMLNLFRLPVRVVQIVHGDSNYYYQTVNDYCGFVSGYVATSQYIAERVSKMNIDQRSAALVKKVFASVPRITPMKGVKPFSPLRLVYLGRIEKEKGSHLLLPICEGLIARGISFKLDVIGSGSYAPLLEREIKESNSINFRGFLTQQEAFRILQESHILVFPSYSEAVGLSVVEAMKAGVVPVVSDLPSGIPELVHNGKTGYLISIGDSEGFADRVSHLAGDEALWQEMREEAIQVANSAFDPAVQAAELQEFFIEVINTPASGTRFHLESAGSRLDQRFVPNWLTRILRQLKDRITK